MVYVISLQLSLYSPSGTDEYNKEIYHSYNYRMSVSLYTDGSKERPEEHNIQYKEGIRFNNMKKREGEGIRFNNIKKGEGEGIRFKGIILQKKCDSNKTTTGTFLSIASS